MDGANGATETAAREPDISRRAGAHDDPENAHAQLHQRGPLGTGRDARTSSAEPASMMVTSWVRLGTTRCQRRSRSIPSPIRLLPPPPLLITPPPPLLSPHHPPDLLPLLIRRLPDEHGPARVLDGAVEQAHGGGEVGGCRAGELGGDEQGWRGGAVVGLQGRAGWDSGGEDQGGRVVSTGAKREQRGKLERGALERGANWSGRQVRASGKMERETSWSNRPP